MRIPLVFIALTGFYLCLAPMTKAQGIAPAVSKSFPFRVEMIMDGGTLAIVEKASKGKPEQRYCIDSQINSSTIGELFIGNVHPTAEGARQVKTKEAVEVLAHIERRLKDFLGAEKMKAYREKPIDFEAMSEADAEKNVKDPEFNDRVATQILLGAIDQYRKSHKAEQATPGQPATRSEAKPEGSDKPQPASEGRSR